MPTIGHDKTNEMRVHTESPHSRHPHMFRATRDMLQCTPTNSMSCGLGSAVGLLPTDVLCVRNLEPNPDIGAETRWKCVPINGYNSVLVFAHCETEHTQSCYASFDVTEMEYTVLMFFTVMLFASLILCCICFCGTLALSYKLFGKNTKST